MSHVLTEKNVFEVLMYLFDHYMEGEGTINASLDEVSVALADAGFETHDVENALIWLEQLHALQEQLSAQGDMPAHGQRIFSPMEKDIIEDEALHFVVDLEQRGIINANTRELVFTMSMLLGMDQVSLPIIQWVTMMVLYNMPEQHPHLDQVVSLVLTDKEDAARH